MTTSKENQDEGLRQVVLRNLRSLNTTLCSFAEPLRPLTVTLSDRAATNGEELMLPADLLADRDENRLLILGLIVHELGHYHYTDFDLLQEFLLGRKWGDHQIARAAALLGCPPQDLHYGRLRMIARSWLNALEDPRVESLMRGRLFSAEALLSYTHGETDLVGDPAEFATAFAAQHLSRRIASLMNVTLSAGLCAYPDVDYATLTALITADLEGALGKRVVGAMRRELSALLQQLRHSPKDGRAALKCARTIFAKALPAIAGELRLPP
ncbi:MAG: hypothetical protein K6A65_06430, partial [Succinivibrionaceae bacterium]|nr:hypothetical protein [Succinivibrionaceae bacterium]